MGLEDDIAILGQVALFRDFERDQLRLLAFSSENRRFSDHEAVFEHNAPAEGGVVVLSGSAVRVHDTHDGPEIVQRAQPGSLIDEMKLIAPGRREGRCVALGDTSVLVIRRALFRRVLSEYPALARSVHAIWSDRLRETNTGLQGVRLRLDSIDRIVDPLSSVPGISIDD